MKLDVKAMAIALGLAWGIVAMFLVGVGNLIVPPMARHFWKWQPPFIRDTQPRRALARSSLVRSMGWWTAPLAAQSLPGSTIASSRPDPARDRATPPHPLLSQNALDPFFDGIKQATEGAFLLFLCFLGVNRLTLPCCFTRILRCAFL